MYHLDLKLNGNYFLSIKIKNINGICIYSEYFSISRCRLFNISHKLCNSDNESNPEIIINESDVSLYPEEEIEDDTIVTYNEFINQKILKIYNDDSNLYEIGFKSSDKGIIFFVSKYNMITNFILNSYEEQQFKDEFKKLD